MRTIPALLTPREVAAALRISEASVYRHLAGGVLPAVRVGGHLRVRADTLEHLLQDGRAASHDAAAPTRAASGISASRGRSAP